jgi:hypothetical protein
MLLNSMFERLMRSSHETSELDIPGVGQAVV